MKVLEDAMIIYILLLAGLIALNIFVSLIRNWFSNEELKAMGIQLEQLH
jgi:hypothetical protein